MAPRRLQIRQPRRSRKVPLVSEEDRSRKTINESSELVLDRLENTPWVCPYTEPAGRESCGLSAQGKVPFLPWQR